MITTGVMLTVLSFVIRGALKETKSLLDQVKRETWQHDTDEIKIEFLHF